MARQTREEVRPTLKAGEVMGRDGTVKRRNKDLEDPYNIPEHLREEGWSYQWNRATCLNAPDQMEINRMMNNGWEYVRPNSRLGELYGVTDKDYIEIGGLVLMERRQELTDEAIEENRMRTAEQYGALMGKSSDLSVPKGYENRGKIVKRTGREGYRADALATIPDE
jgi:hypothetical protein